MTPLDSVVGMQQNIANPVRCQKKTSYKEHKSMRYSHGNKKWWNENIKSIMKSRHVLEPFTSDKFTREELNLHNKLSKKGCKQQNRSLQLYTIILDISKLIEGAPLMTNRSMGTGIPKTTRKAILVVRNKCLSLNYSLDQMGVRTLFQHTYSCATE